MRGTRFWNCTLLPVLTLMTSKILPGSSPAFLPNTSASAIATVAIWPSMLLINFIARPWPRSPTWKTFLPIARNRSSLAAKVSAGPPTITDRVPAARAVSAPADRRIEHRYPFLCQLFRKAPRGEWVDRAHAQHDITLLRRLDDALLAEDHGFGLGSGLDHADRAVAAGGDGLG